MERIVRAEYIIAISESAKKVFEKEAHINLKRKDIERKVHSSSSMSIRIVIWVSGSVNGRVVFSMGREFADFLGSMITGNSQSGDVGELANSAVCEIANMITGRATIRWAGEDGMISITPPVLFSESDKEVDFLDVPTISLSFISKIGELKIDMALSR